MDEIRASVTVPRAQPAVERTYAVTVCPELGTYNVFGSKSVVAFSADTHSEPGDFSCSAQLSTPSPSASRCAFDPSRSPLPPMHDGSGSSGQPSPSASFLKVTCEDAVVGAPCGPSYSTSMRYVPGTHPVVGACWSPGWAPVAACVRTPPGPVMNHLKVPVLSPPWA